jgi:hypothetical protein
MSDLARTPGYRVAYNINPRIEALNSFDSDGNPTGGNVYLKVTKNGDTEHPAMVINWQDGPRGTDMQNADGTPVLADPNGAFVEDVIWAAIQRLEFFNESKYRCRENSLAITKLEEALFILKDRQLSRSERNVEGKHEV